MIYAATRVGKNHSVSEDAVLIGTEILRDTETVMEYPETGFVCIADGVGGNSRGDQASQLVLEGLLSLDLTTVSLDTGLHKVNEDLIQKAKETGLSDMAATLTGICHSERDCQLLHIGNTRAYIKQGNYLKQLTSDHTTYNWLKSTGQIEAAEGCNKSEITNCFGGGDPALLSKLVITDIASFSMMVLTSDGIHDHVDIDDLEDIICGDIPRGEICSRIIEKAVADGSEDDMTVVIICPAEEM